MICPASPANNNCYDCADWRGLIVECSPEERSASAGPRRRGRDFHRPQSRAVRGCHIFMRSLPNVMQKRPEADVVINRGRRTSYGDRAREGVEIHISGGGQVRGLTFRELIPSETFHTSYCEIYCKYCLSASTLPIRPPYAGRCSRLLPASVW